MKNDNVTCFNTGWSALLDVELWVKWIDIFTSLAAVAIAGYALYVACNQLSLGWQQLKVNRDETRSATAHNLYHQYLTLCIEKPEFANGMAKPVDRCSEYSKYCWFVSSMLFTFEQILETKSTDDKWQRTIKSQLQTHKVFLASSRTVREREWNDELQTIIDQILE